MIRTARPNLSSKSQLLLFLDLGVLTAKTLHPTRCVHQFLLAGEERMAVGADFNINTFAGRTGGETGPAGTGDRHLVILWMNLRFQLSLPRQFNSKATQRLPITWKPTGEYTQYFGVGKSVI